MAPDHLLYVFSKALPSVDWRDATHPPEASKGPVVAAEVSPVLTLVGWEDNESFVVIALNEDHKVISTQVNDNPQKAVLQALKEGYCWLTRQLETLCKSLSDLTHANQKVAVVS